MITIPFWLLVVLIFLSTFFVILFIDEMVLRWKEKDRRVDIVMGPQGPQGAQGFNGEKGEKGDPGRDSDFFFQE